MEHVTWPHRIFLTLSRPEFRGMTARIDSYLFGIPIPFTAMSDICSKVG